MTRILGFVTLSWTLTVPLCQAQEKPDKPALLRAGIIGLDTSHVTAFTQVLNNPNNTGDLAGIKVVAAFPGGSPDLPDSRDRVEGFTKTLRDKYGVEIVASIDELLKKVDVVLLESVDGRPHLKQLIPVLKAGKLCFIDKPVAGSLADALMIYHLAKQYKVPIFSSSSLRFSPGIARMRNDPKAGKVMGCLAYGPCPLEEHHPDLFWYGIHGVETLFTIMGPGCKTVTRTHTKGTDEVTGTWDDGRIGTFRGIRAGQLGYGALVFGSKGIVPSGGYGGYEPLLVEICKFFRTGKPPVSAEETIEIFAFMEAADESKRQGGAPVTLKSVIAKARAQNEKPNSQTRSPEESEEGFVSMFNGKDFAGWRFSAGARVVKSADNWKVEDGMIRLLGGGSPHLGSQWDYEDFDLRLQWRAHQKGYNSGLFIRSGRSVGANQINLAQSDAGHLMGGAPGGKAVPDLQKPPGEWNDWRVLAVGDKVTLWCNGKKAWDVTGFKNPRGYIGLQAEGAAIDFKNIRIKEVGYESLNDPKKWIRTDTKHWKWQGNQLSYDGMGNPLARRVYSDFILRLEWKSSKKGDGPGLVVNEEFKNTRVNLNHPQWDNAPGQWNYAEAQFIGAKLSLWLNGTMAEQKSGLVDFVGILIVSPGPMEFQNLRIKAIKNRSGPDR